MVLLGSPPSQQDAQGGAGRGLPCNFCGHLTHSKLLFMNSGRRQSRGSHCLVTSDIQKVQSLLQAGRVGAAWHGEPTAAAGCGPWHWPRAESISRGAPRGSREQRHRWRWVRCPAGTSARCLLLVPSFGFYLVSPTASPISLHNSEDHRAEAMTILTTFAFAQRPTVNKGPFLARKPIQLIVSPPL